MSVNVSVRQLADPSFAVDAEAICRVTGIDPQRVELEITETAFAMNLEAMKVRLSALKALGFRIVIDDFGTGYSSLSYLREFPVDVIKIDRSFITELDHSAEDLLLLRGVVELAHSLQLTVVSEGVETDEQFRALQAMRCDRAQGYLFARPGDPSTIALHTGTRRDLTSTPHAVRAHIM